MIGLPILLQPNMLTDINRSQTHEFRNWDWGRAIPFLGIHKWDFRCNVVREDGIVGTNVWECRLTWTMMFLSSCQRMHSSLLMTGTRTLLSTFVPVFPKELSVLPQPATSPTLPWCTRYNESCFLSTTILPFPDPCTLLWIPIWTLNWLHFSRKNQQNYL